MTRKSKPHLPGNRLSPHRRLLTFLPLILMVLGGLLSCDRGGGITGLDTSNLQILILSGDGQVAEAGTPVALPLEVRVQAASNGRVSEGVEVRWAVVEGNGGRLDEERTVTDSAGVTSVHLTLGTGLGDYQVEASVKGMTAPAARFTARAIVSPELTSVPSGVVEAGEVIRIEGRHLSEIPAENVVTFSDIRGRVVAATSTSLEVEVPPCLPSRVVTVRLWIGGLSTGTASLQVVGSDQVLSLDVGEDRIFEGVDALACFQLPSATGTSYLVVPHTTGTVGGAEYPILVQGLAPGGASPGAGAVPGPAGVERLAGAGWGDPIPAAHWVWEADLRRLERELVSSRNGRGRAEGGLARSAAPEAAASVEVGDTRKFKVLNSDKGFDNITASVRYITEHGLIYVDEETPAGGFSQEDLAYFAGEFEDAIYPTVVGSFGSESDLDSNGRVVILFTPGVNRLTTEDSGGYVGGFFFGLDLLPERKGSNDGEIFYAVVPDPTGIHGPSLGRSTLLASLPAILAHEFEHMVHFNQRILLGGAPEQDALWLSEALAQMAEDLVGAHYQEHGDPGKATEYQAGNWGRAERFLQNPSQVSVLTTLPPGTLAERGAGWLLLKYLYGMDDSGQLLHALVSSQRTGVDNVVHVTGSSWPEIVSDWVGSLYLDGVSVPVRSGLQVLGVNLREVLSNGDGSYPLAPLDGGGSFSIQRSLWPSAPDYYILRPVGPGGMAVNVSGPDGRPLDPASGLRILVVRLQ